MKNILLELSKHFVIKELNLNIERFSNLTIEQEALLIASSYYDKPRPIVIIKPNLYLAQQLYNKLQMLLMNDSSVFLYSQEDSLRVEEIASSTINLADKVEATIKSLTLQNPLCVTHVGAVIRKIPKKETILSSNIDIKIDKEIHFDALVNQIQTLGYSKTIRVDQPLMYANRGNIIDIYDVAYDYPVRIEFFDNVIESIRFFDIHTQRTVNTISEIIIHCATDLLWTKHQKHEIQMLIKQTLNKYNKSEDVHLLSMLRNDLDEIAEDNYHPRFYAYFAMCSNGATILDYFLKPQVIVSAYEQSLESYKKIVEDNFEFLNERFEQQNVINYDDLFKDIASIITKYRALRFFQFQTVDEIQVPWHPIDLGATTLKQKLKYLTKEYKHNTVLLVVSASHVHTLIETLLGEDIKYVMAKDNLESEMIHVYVHDLDFGFEYKEKKLIVVSEHELFNVKSKNAKHINRFKEAEALSSYDQLKEGDFVVHQEHGIGKYLGIVNKLINKIKTDYLHIEYRDEAKLFIPLEQFQLVRKFVSMEGIVPRLNKLGTSEWQKTKQKVSESVSEIADQLISLYSEREKHIGYAYKEDDEQQKQFEEEFEYESTYDQLVAVNEIKADMESSKPMDRLLCGDVGFGKTEVAMRAAFKAISENKQVAFLCPTTVLSFQHLKTFTERFKNHAVNIQVLNRFILPSKQNRIINDVKKHKVDILIGTHRILSSDIKYSDLGLLIIDEEQRFGVEHKEKIKQLKSSIDVLSLSATPIPRTLQMSLIGLRSLSQLNTPPQNRMPIQTYIVVKNRLLIKEIIERELSRNGQVFYLFNQIERIYQVANQIQDDIPGISIGVAHGKMDREAIEDVMIRFINNEYQVLVCTTIIETGIDIPNANTMIVDQAENFGLSQLYQIRGRVGRSNRVAYTYLMYPPKKQLSEIAQKRLQAIKEFTQLGSGYKIAMRDLTIRGAGDMLGDKQSGFINTVGMDMYIELLKEAIAIKQNKPIEKPVVETSLNIQVEAYIPKKFTEEDLSKINIYQAIQKIKSLTQLQKYNEEIVDNYGKLPSSVEMIFEKKRLEILLRETRIESFKERQNHVECIFTQPYSQTINGIAWFEAISEMSSNIQLKYNKNKISIHIKKVEEWLLLLNQVLVETKKEKYYAD